MADEYYGTEDSDFKKRNALWGEYADAWQDRADPETDPEYWSPERVANRERWRKGSNLLQDNVARQTEMDARAGLTGDQSLNRMGFHDQKDRGKYIFGQFGNEGLYAREGAAVDPNLNYDWATGRATWKAGTDNAGKSRAINANERAEYEKARGYRDQGLQGYGQQANATSFQKAANAGQFTWNDKLGLYVNPGQAAAGDYGNWQFYDKLGRRVATPRGDLSFLAGDAGQDQGLPDYQQPNPDRGLPSLPGYGGGDYMSLLNGGGGSQPFTGSVPAPQNQFNNQQMRQQTQQQKKTDASAPYQQLIAGGQKKQGQSTALGAF